MAKQETLTEKQQAFVEAFCGECHFDAVAAYKAAGYVQNTFIYAAAQRVLASELVRKAIHAQLQDSQSWLDQKAVIDRLWKEGLTANSPSARINALVWVGKYLGMWEEQKKEESSGPKVEIVQYLGNQGAVQTIQNTPNIDKKAEAVSLPEGVQVLSYGKEPKAKE